MLNGKITFGVELECVKLTSQASQLIQQHGFQRHFDGSIRGPRGEALPSTIEAGGGSEVVTPVYAVDLQMDAEGKHLQLDYGTSKAAIKAMCDCASEINTSCGIHVHLGNPGRDGKSIWKPEAVRTMLAICTLKEEQFFKLVPPSRHNNRHCARIKERFNENDLQSFYPIGTPMPRKSDNPKRYCWLNLIETRRKGTDSRPNRQASEATGTIEIRLLGNTRRFDYIWSWVQLWVKIAAYVSHLSPSMALMHCAITDSLATEMEAVTTARNSAGASDRIVESNEEASEPIRPSRPMPRAPQPLRTPRVPNIQAPAFTSDDTPAPSPVIDEVEPESAVSTDITVRRGNRTERV